MSWARTCFLTVSWKNEPPFTVASLAMIMQGVPAITPMPVTMPADGHLVVVEAPGGERRELEKGRERIDQQVDALAHRHLVARVVTLDQPRSAARQGMRMTRTQLDEQRRRSAPRWP